MHAPDMNLGERGYEREHIDMVLAAIRQHFPAYFATFAPTARKAFQTAVAEWQEELPHYEDLLDPDSLEEYEDDPGSFKACIKSRCPIIRRSFEVGDDCLGLPQHAETRVSPLSKSRLGQFQGLCVPTSRRHASLAVPVTCPKIRKAREFRHGRPSHARRDFITRVFEQDDTL